MRALPGVTAAGAIDNLPLEGRVRAADRGGGTSRAALARTADRAGARGDARVPGGDGHPRAARARRRPRGPRRDAGEPCRREAACGATRTPIGQRVTLPLISRTRSWQVVGIVGDVKQGDLSEAPLPSVYLYTRENARNRTDARPAHVGAAGDAVRRRRGRHARARSGAAGRGRAHDGRGARRAARVPAVQRAPPGRVRGAGARPGHGRHLQRPLVHRPRPRREIGIRSALGASTADVLRLVVREGMTPALAGIAAGAPGGAPLVDGPAAPGVRGERLGSADAGRGRRDAGDGRPARLPRAGLARDPDRPRDHPARLSAAPSRRGRPVRPSPRAGSVDGLPRRAGDRGAAAG